MSCASYSRCESGRNTSCLKFQYVFSDMCGFKRRQLCIAWNSGLPRAASNCGNYSCTISHDYVTQRRYQCRQHNPPSILGENLSESYPAWDRSTEQTNVVFEAVITESLSLNSPTNISFTASTMLLFFIILGTSLESVGLVRQVLHCYKLTSIRRCIPWCEIDLQLD